MRELKASNQAAAIGVMHRMEGQLTEVGGKGVKWKIKRPVIFAKGNAR